MGRDLLEIIKHPSGLNIVRTVVPEELITNGFKVYGSSSVKGIAYFFVKTGVKNA